MACCKTYLSRRDCDTREGVVANPLIEDIRCRWNCAPELDSGCHHRGDYSSTSASFDLRLFCDELNEIVRGHDDIAVLVLSRQGFMLFKRK